MLRGLGLIATAATLLIVMVLVAINFGSSGLNQPLTPGTGPLPAEQQQQQKPGTENPSPEKPSPGSTAQTPGQAAASAALVTTVSDMLRVMQLELRVDPAISQSDLRNAIEQDVPDAQQLLRLKIGAGGVKMLRGRRGGATLCYQDTAGIRCRHVSARGQQGSAIGQTRSGSARAAEDQAGRR